MLAGELSLQVSQFAEVQDLRRYLPAAVHLSPSVTVFQTALSARAGPPPGGLLAVLERIQIRDPVRVCWHPRQGECAFSLAYFHNFYLLHLQYNT